MNALQILALALLSVMAAQAQVIMPGRCPQPAVQKDFDTERYLGTWFGIQKLPHAFQKSECSTATYSLKSPGVVGVFNRGLLANGTVSTISGTATAKDPSEPAKLLVTFFNTNSPPAPYWVLDTDYDSYSLVYSCTDLEDQHKDHAWIMSREPTLSLLTLERLQDTLASVGVRVDKLITTVQDEEYCAAL